MTVLLKLVILGLCTLMLKKHQFSDKIVYMHMNLYQTLKDRKK